MKKKVLFTGVAAITAILISCYKVPITGRRQMNMIPESEMISMSLTNYKEFLTQNPPTPPNNADAELVKKVGNKIAQAVQAFMKSKGLSKRLNGYQWEFNLVNQNTVNAWCMPGGKVVVYSGLLPVTQTEPALACVLGHEIAHAVARHGNERMSQGLIAQAGGVALIVALAQKSTLTRTLFLQSYGVTSQLGLLKYDRSLLASIA